MKASIAHGVRPSALVLGRDSRKPWGKWDYLLAKAYQRFLGELCSQCGMPRWMCDNDDNRIQFAARENHCAAMAVAEKAQDAITSKKNAQKRFGVQIIPEPFLTEDAIADGLEFSDFRRPYYRERARRKALAEQ